MAENMVTTAHITDPELPIEVLAPKTITTADIMYPAGPAPVDAIVKVPLCVAGVEVTVFKITIVLWFIMLSIYAWIQEGKASYAQEDFDSSLFTILLFAAMAAVFACLIAIIIEIGGVYIIPMP